MRIIRAAEHIDSPSIRDYLRVYPGAYLDLEGADPAKVTPEQRHVARIAGCAPALRVGVISGTSAAILHGLPVRADRAAAPVEVTRPSHSSPSRWLRSRHARLAPDEIESIHGIRVTSLARTLRDLHEHFDFGEMLAAADGALRLGADLDGLDAPGRHSDRLARLRAHASDRSESYGESVSRAAMIEAGLPLPALQVTVLDDRGLVVARNDFWWEWASTAGEFDGEIKYDGTIAPDRTREQVLAAQHARDAELQALGRHTEHWRWEAATDPAALAAQLRSAFEIGMRMGPRRGASMLLPVERLAAPCWGELLADAVAPDRPRG